MSHCDLDFEDELQEIIYSRIEMAGVFTLTYCSASLTAV